MFLVLRKISVFCKRWSNNNLKKLSKNSFLSSFRSHQTLTRILISRRLRKNRSRSSTVKIFSQKFEVRHFSLVVGMFFFHDDLLYIFFGISFSVTGTRSGGWIRFVLIQLEVESESEVRGLCRGLATEWRVYVMWCTEKRETCTFYVCF